MAKFFLCRAVSTTYCLQMLLLAFYLTLSSINEGIYRASAAPVDPMIKWIEANAGFFSDKVEFRNLDSENEGNSYGLFAKESLKEKESIMIIPKKCLLTSGGSGNMCDTTWNLVEQFNLGEESFFKEYVTHMFDEEGKLPESWSGDGQDILREVLGTELTPEISRRSFKKHCKGSGHILEEHAYDHVLSRSWHDVMVPLYDIVPHRNGLWHNCEATSAHTDEDVTVYAYRDIKEGEQIYTSYNDCLDEECKLLFGKYGTQHLLMDYGFVEDYPQRWIFEIDNLEQETETISFELDQIVIKDPYDSSLTRTELNVHWHTNVRPDLQMINNMLSQLKRLRGLDNYVSKKIQQLSSKHEREVIKDFHRSLKSALQYSIWAAMDAKNESDQTCDASLGAEACVANASNYDSLDSMATESDTSEEPYVCHHSAMRIGGRGYQNWDVVESQYQEIAFKYNEMLDDTCLWLSGWAQTCTSFRQYHEALVHYPATFVEEVKRVAFIGGGDNMIVHEILKYPSLELAVGMELDQQVLRSSFKNLGTLPYFDDSRVQWWFGDATKSLLMLPKEYFGTFDLLFVDLQTFVADALKVTPDLSVMDTLKLLLKPNGIIAKNEDFPNRQVTDFAKYTVDLEYCDLPALCRQSITIGSNGIDLLKAKHYNHNVDTIYLKKSLTESGRFNEWFGFRKNIKLDENKTQGSISSPQQQEECSDDNDGTTAVTSSQKYGVFLVIEAEDLDSNAILPDTALDLIKNIVKSYGMTLLGVSGSQGKEDITLYDAVLILREGYIAIRKRSSYSYASVDLALWDKVDEMDALKASLLTSLGGDKGAASTYRFVIGGMTGVSEDPYAWQLVKGESADNDHNIDGIAEELKNGNELIYNEIIKLIPNKDRVIIVICGEKNKKCDSFEVLKNTAENVIPIFTCPGLQGKSHEINEDLLLNCETKTMQLLKKSVASSKINAIWLDKSAERPIAQIILKFLKTKIGKIDLLQENYVVVTQLYGSISEERWRKIFLERFRTEVTPFFDPAKEAHVLVSSKEGGTMELGIYSSGDEMFYLNLANLAEAIDKSKILNVSVQNVLSGYANYVPDFSPKFFNNAAYDKTRSSKQWLSQTPIGIQTLFKFELNAPKVSLNVGDKVLYRYYDEVWVGQWIDATVLEVREDNMYDLVDAKGKTRRSIGRDFIRPVENDKFTTYKIGERILIKLGRFIWNQGILSRAQGEDTFQVRVFDGDGTTVNNVPKKDLISQFEGTLEKDLPTLSSEILEKLLSQALKSHAKKVTDNFGLRSYPVGNGCVIVALWDDGNVILSWDGMKHVDINLYFHGADSEKVSNSLEEKFLTEIPYLMRQARDIQPRGSGRVVNFFNEIDEDPYWLKN